MSYAIVYSSKTGNTRLLAETIRQALPSEDCVYMGPPSPQALEAGRIYVGFWTDKGICDGETAAFLATLSQQEVFLFGTAGFGGDPAYFEKILARTREHLPASATVVGSWMCQGKMPQAVRSRYEAMEESPRRKASLENFDRALSHPDAADLEGIRQAVTALSAR